MSKPAAHPDGHFYSPVVDPNDLRHGQLWPKDPEVLGINFNDENHQRVLREWFPRHIGNYTYPENAPAVDQDLTSFYTQNSQFSWLDSRALFVILMETKPNKIIEVGSGYSSLLMADVNNRFLGCQTDITCVEPYPRPFLKKTIPGLTRVLEQKVQDVPLDVFSSLAAGDILFIDSSHVAKTGSDVNYLYFEVLPRLAQGVRIHIHDIFLPNEYPVEWVINENRSWNEQYLVRALLMYSHGFGVEFGCSYAFHKHKEDVISALSLASGAGFAGGSLWLVKS